MPNPEMTLVTIEGHGEPPSLERAAAQIGVHVDDLDATFGVVPLNVADRLYAVQVRADRLPERFASGKRYTGPYSNPRIEPFGPVGDGTGKPESD